MDSDGDGLVDRDEFKHFMRSMQRPGTEPNASAASNTSRGSSPTQETAAKLSPHSSPTNSREGTSARERSKQNLQGPPTAVSAVTLEDIEKPEDRLKRLNEELMQTQQQMLEAKDKKQRKALRQRCRDLDAMIGGEHASYREWQSTSTAVTSDAGSLSPVNSREGTPLKARSKQPTTEKQSRAREEAAVEQPQQMLASAKASGNAQAKRAVTAAEEEKQAVTSFADKHQDAALEEIRLRAVKIFKQADLNSDGELAVTELGRYATEHADELAEVTEPGMPQWGDLAQLYKYDTNADGVIQCNEWVEYYLARAAELRCRAETKPVEAEVDTTTVAESEAASQQSSGPVMRAMDSDGDGLVDRDEFKHFMQSMQRPGTEPNASAASNTSRGSSPTQETAAKLSPHSSPTNSREGTSARERSKQNLQEPPTAVSAVTLEDIEKPEDRLKRLNEELMQTQQQMLEAKDKKQRKALRQRCRDLDAMIGGEHASYREWQSTSTAVTSDAGSLSPVNSREGTPHKARSKQPTTEKQSGPVMGAMDSDGDGLVDRDEFKHFMQSMQRPGTEPNAASKRPTVITVINQEPPTAVSAVTLEDIEKPEDRLKRLNEELMQTQQQMLEAKDKKQRKALRQRCRDLDAMIGGEHASYREWQSTSTAVTSDAGSLSPVNSREGTPLKARSKQQSRDSSPAHDRGSDWRNRLTGQVKEASMTPNKSMEAVRETAAKLSPHSSPVNSREGTPLKARSKQQSRDSSPAHDRGSDWRNRLTGQVKEASMTPNKSMEAVRETAAKLSPYSSPVNSREGTPARERSQATNMKSVFACLSRDGSARPVTYH